MIRSHEIYDPHSQFFLVLDHQQRVIYHFVLAQKGHVFFKRIEEPFVALLINEVRMVIFIDFEVGVQSCYVLNGLGNEEAVYF